MRWLGLSLVLLVAGSVAGQGQSKLAKRYNFDVNLDLYPQKTPQEALQSIAKAVDNKRVDYLLAHLADPRFVDDAVAANVNAISRGSEQSKRFLAFDRLVSETTHYFLEDPTLIKELRRFGKEAAWQINEDLAIGTLKSVQGRQVFLRKHEDRWFLENKQQ
jgi:hypothetical protein